MLKYSFLICPILDVEVHIEITILGRDHVSYLAFNFHTLTFLAWCSRTATTVVLNSCATLCCGWQHGDSVVDHLGIVICIRSDDSGLKFRMIRACPPHRGYVLGETNAARRNLIQGVTAKGRPELEVRLRDRIYT